ncbi:MULTISPECIES: histone-like nucleoid-structuring protein, MvaT/MvaU family [Marinobacter]|uniref:Histone-like nucleoid-structuring protein, MvaT/MvaU family n=1 Tax=Marinobacter xestospongiae TaxID=994319 RepID=A0ABU3W083_9GAMM|nr:MULTISPECIES: histone-like nucleoid-structuring protein, MvaT/MvaU family [Marinobacter]MCG8516429.1 H-NS histone family protein [Pseudomonadales bacterium]MCK7568893.1 H-NS histone family protein [Marinobacter xestospongiae]MDV2079948.1 histone-like nucleoid-structuring protein, MvaT/MvaU family [Marinobacter xestospongiae]UDL03814.1 H-NS histone family protein [Marinobacter sp. CA1]
MAKINDYYQKKQLMEKLSEELRQLEQDQALKKELEFEDKVRDLMKEYEKSPKHVLQILNAIDPAIGGGKADAGTGTRAKRPMKTYRNPHTGETVKTRGGNHKTLNEWRDKYGKDAVHSWQEA